MPDNMTQAMLTYQFSGTRPIELVTISRSMLALGEQFDRFARRRGLMESAHALYVKRISTGSLIMDLLGASAAVAPLIPQFAEAIKGAFDVIKGVKTLVDAAKDLLIEPTDVQRIEDLVAPALDDNAAKVQITAHQGAVIILGSVTGSEVKAGINRLRAVEVRESPIQPPPDPSIHADGPFLTFTDQNFYWYQISANKSAKAANKGVIQTLTYKPVRVTFASQEIREEMIDRRDNPLRNGYQVDVVVFASANKPTEYRIVNVKEIYNRELAAA